MKLGHALIGVSRKESAAADADHSAEGKRVKMKERAAKRVARALKRMRRRDRNLMPCNGARAQVALRAVRDVAPRVAVAPKLRGTR